MFYFDVAYLALFALTNSKGAFLWKGIDWKGDKNNNFIVKANYRMIEGGNPKAVPLNLLWNSCVPLKVRFFAWEAW